VLPRGFSFVSFFSFSSFSSSFYLEAIRAQLVEAALMSGHVGVSVPEGKLLADFVRPLHQHGPQLSLEILPFLIRESVGRGVGKESVGVDESDREQEKNQINSNSNSSFLSIQINTKKSNQFPFQFTISIQFQFQSILIFNHLLFQ